MAKIDETVFTVQIKAVNTILQLCYTLKDYVKSLIEQGNGNIDDIATINAHLLLLDNEIMQITSDITNLNNNKLNKVSTESQVMQAYVKQPNGNQQMIDVHWNSNADTIPIRDQTGNIRVALTPTNNSHATSKQYTDNGDLFENIKDNNGNARFIEGTITPNSITGITYSYTRWSLSGSHLMIVLAGSTTSETTITGSTPLSSINIPSWVYDKIYPSFGSNIVMATTATIRNAAGGSFGDMSLRLVKENDDLYIRNVSNITISTDRYFRIQFDLVIDNS